MPQNSSERPRVLFVAGDGIDHLTRLRAIATRCSEQVNPYLTTVTGDVRPVEQLVQRLRPALVVVDHENPPPEIHTMTEASSGIHTIWVRTRAAMADAQRVRDEQAQPFDHLLEPLDLGVGHSDAPRVHPRAYRVPPISLVDADGMLSRADARQALQLPLGARVVLVDVAAGTIDDLAWLLTRVRNRLAQDRLVPMIYVPDHHPDARNLPSIDGVVIGQDQPIARYLHSFDAGIVTPGYAAFHDLVLAATPSLYVSADAASADDLRALAAEQGAYGIRVAGIDSAGLDVALNDLLDADTARRLRTAAVVAYSGNGAAEAARLVTKLAQGVKIC